MTNFAWQCKKRTSFVSIQPPQERFAHPPSRLAAKGAAEGGGRRREHLKRAEKEGRRRAYGSGAPVATAFRRTSRP